MKKVIECPYCDGQAKLDRQAKELTYRKDLFKVVEHFYKCDLCKEEFTTTETDTVTLLQAHNQYREKYSIPFPEEIYAIRENYELSATKMSEVLGLGINGYANYEKGEIPTPAIGNLIYTADNPEVFKMMLEKAKHYFSDGMYSSTIDRVSFIIDKHKGINYYQWKLNQHTEPNSFTGFKKINKDKIANVLIAFITKCNNEYNDRLKLNKLLFYTDFLCYKLTGYSITGLTYRAIQYGPVPTFYDNIYTCLENEGGIISNWVKDENGSAKENFVTDGSYDSHLFSPHEQLIIDLIAENFKDISTWDLVDLSHKEKGWIELHAEKKTINYQTYAFELMGA